MAKKQKRNLQELLEKKRQLQQLQKNNDGVLPATTWDTTTAVSPVAESSIDLIDRKPTQKLSRSTIRRTLFSVAIIVLLLIGSAIVEHRTTKLNGFGNWLYQTLRLQQS